MGGESPLGWEKTEDCSHWALSQPLTNPQACLWETPILPQLLKQQLLTPASSSSLQMLTVPWDVLVSVRRSGKENQVLPN